MYIWGEVGGGSGEEVEGFEVGGRRWEGSEVGGRRWAGGGANLYMRTIVR